MNSSDLNDEPDPRLRDGLRALPIPETPSALEARVRQRLRRRRLKRGTLGAGSVLALTGALLVWSPWAEVEGPPLVVQQPQPAPSVAHKRPPREIPADELAVLFAPPPVDSLMILDRRDRGTVAALNRMEGVK